MDTCKPYRFFPTWFLLKKLSAKCWALGKILKNNGLKKQSQPCATQKVHQLLGDDHPVPTCVGRDIGGRGAEVLWGRTGKNTSYHEFDRCSLIRICQTSSNLYTIHVPSSDAINSGDSQGPAGHLQPQQESKNCPMTQRWHVPAKCPPKKWINKSEYGWAWVRFSMCFHVGLCRQWTPNLGRHYCKSGDSHPKVSAVSAVAHAHLLSDSRALSNGRYASCDMVTWNAWWFCNYHTTLASGATGDAKARYVCNNHSVSQLKSRRLLICCDGSTRNLRWIGCASGPSKLQVAPARHSNLLLKFQKHRKDRKGSNRMYPTQTNSAISAWGHKNTTVGNIHLIEKPSDRNPDLPPVQRWTW